MLEKQGRGMRRNSWMRSTSRVLLRAIWVTAASYITYVTYIFFRYGRVTLASSTEHRDALLDRLMPAYEVMERHRVYVYAPAETTFMAACHMNFQSSAIIRSIFRARELIFASKRAEVTHSLGL